MSQQTDKQNLGMQSPKTNTPQSTINSSQAMDYGTMNAKDAKESGYTDESGKAVDMAKPDVKGSPTGAYTDIGAGRSGVVTAEGGKNKTSEDAPSPRGEQAP
ncbi:MAG: hypothetical protein H7061_01835 [Bdellovibrionaceae bacterium]|nr:hypothetical protein [Bdellovibrio sp.]